MYRILIVDDERIEREGIKYLIGREKGDYEILRGVQWEAGIGCVAQQEGGSFDDRYPYASYGWSGVKP